MIVCPICHKLVDSCCGGNAANCPQDGINHVVNHCEFCGYDKTDGEIY